MKKIQLLLGISFFMFGCQQDTPMILYKNDIKVEYGHKIKENDIFAKNQDLKNLTITDIKNFDAFKVGKQQVELLFSNGTKDVLDVCVIDTKKPKIHLKDNYLVVKENIYSEIQNNVDFVNDEVDGNLSYFDHEIKRNGYYIDTHKVKVSTQGIYDVKVYAVDNNGNVQDASFKVEVKKGVKKDLHKDIPVLDDDRLTLPTHKQDHHEVTKEQTLTHQDDKPKPSIHQHDFDASGYENIIWSNKIFDDTTDALNWAEQYALEQKQWSIGGYSVAYCRCGKCQPFFFGVEEWKS